ncbi:PDR/VanB family oxidoreductase (plasmid) [Sphaerotilus natans]|uniref:PDR/VanB family oxidoreductase n=1 Tax=Sphaerotilus natans TaxID=34103 RepID=UPI00406D3E5A
MNAASTLTLTLVAQSLHDLAPGVREIRLAAADGGLLPIFSAGSHVVLALPVAPGRVLRNAYSLLGDPEDRAVWRIAVRRQPDSRGGSAWLHERLHPGQRLEVSAPANLFPLVRTARRHLLVAGGIGITPILSQVRTLARLGADFEVHYAWRSPQQAVFRDELETLAPGRVHHHDASRGGHIDFATLLAHRPLGTHLSLCGPAGMVQAAMEAGRALGWPASALHSERFAGAAPGEPFAVQLARSGRRLEVAGDLSLLEALEQAGVAPPSMCRGGACGVCETAVLAADGELLHADVWLDAAQRREGRRIMPCVSRLRGRCLTLDL